MHYAPEPTGNAPYTAGLATRLAETNTVSAVTAYPHYPQWVRYPGYSGRRSTENYRGVRLTRVTHWIPNPPRGIRRLLSELSFGIAQVAAPWNRPGVAILVSPALFGSAVSALRVRFPRRTPHVIWVQDLYAHGMVETSEGSRISTAIVRHVEGWLLRGADAVVAVHPSMAERMIADLGVSRSRVHVIRNWSHVTPSKRSRAAARARLGWSVSERIVLHSGNMGRKQGLESVVSAARISHERGEDITFVLLGDGSERARLEALGAGVPSLRFMAPLPDEDFADALAAADILLVNELPGVSEMAAPSKLTSYFAASRPVLAAVRANGIVSNILEESKAGRICESGDPEHLLDAALDFLTSPSEMSRAAANGAKYWRRHLSEDAAVDAWGQLIRAVTLRKHEASTVDEQ